ncbi:hypothetical protein GCM10009751_05430 [Myceligenerans crystallogenes]|uniref:Uncharacterized protein n=1 Tax=Myceligenerans crystallogenes TaxID=316335 RepID=A0ABP4ZCY9_9MICO
MPGGDHPPRTHQEHLGRVLREQALDQSGLAPTVGSTIVRDLRKGKLQHVLNVSRERPASPHAHGRVRRGIEDRRIPGLPGT